MDLNKFQHFYGGNRTNNVGRCLHRKVLFTKLKALKEFYSFREKESEITRNALINHGYHGNSSSLNDIVPNGSRLWIKT